jgi:hypothetical protein
MVGTEAESLIHAIQQCAINGAEWEILSPDGHLSWVIERDTKVDDDDLTFPVIVHMTGEAGDGSLVVLRERATA